MISVSIERTAQIVRVTPHHRLNHRNNLSCIGKKPPPKVVAQVRLGRGPLPKHYAASQERSIFHEGEKTRE